MRIIYESPLNRIQVDRVPAFLWPATSSSWGRVIRDNLQFDSGEFCKEIEQWNLARIASINPTNGRQPFCDESIAKIPGKQVGVYFVYGGSSIVYVGKAVDLRGRLHRYVKCLPGESQGIAITDNLWIESKLKLPFEEGPTIEISPVARLMNRALFLCLSFKVKLYPKGLHDVEEIKAIHCFKPRYNSAGIYR